jgi:hypothetical protein
MNPPQRNPQYLNLLLKQLLHNPLQKHPPMTGQILVWKMVPQAITQIPFFYPPPKVSTYQVTTTLTLPNMVISIHVWYLDPPSMVLVPSLPPQLEDFPMQSMVQTPTPPTGHTVGGKYTNKGGKKKKNGSTPQPRVQPPCTLCAKLKHPTNLYPTTTQIT